MERADARPKSELHRHLFLDLIASLHGQSDAYTKLGLVWDHFGEVADHRVPASDVCSIARGPG
jgi:hypothetical protein